MENKLYIRDGKRFKYVPNMLGMYWNGIILTKERMQDSIAIVIEQHYDHVVMVSLTISKNGIDWYKAKEWCKSEFDGKGRLPSNTELINLRKYITTDTLDLPGIALFYVWGEEYSTYIAWYSYWHSSEVYRIPKNRIFYVRSIAVIDVPILDLI